MKYLLLLLLMVTAPRTYSDASQKQNPLAVYAGKYQMTIRGKTGYIQIFAKNKTLAFTSLWNGDQNTAKQLSGDNFIMNLRGWAIKFNRDSNGNIISVLVMGHDLWTKTK